MPIFMPTESLTPLREILRWEAYFMEQKGIRVGVDSIIRSFGIEQLRKVRGNKFVKMYARFIATHPPEVSTDRVAA